MRPRAPRSDAGDADRETVLHIYAVEILYAAVVNGHIDWHKAIVVRRRCRSTRPCTSAGTNGA